MAEAAGQPSASPWPKSRRLLVGLGLPLLAAAATVFLICYDPTRDRPLIPCLFLALTGLDCVGCGLTRAMHALLQGDLIAAASYNIFLLLWLPVPAWYFLGAWLQAIFGRAILPQIRSRRWLMILLLVSAILFLVLRNLPWEPFSWLAA